MNARSLKSNNPTYKVYLGISGRNKFGVILSWSCFIFNCISILIVFFIYNNSSKSSNSRSSDFSSNQTIIVEEIILKKYNSESS